jgi:hypothetical protein
MIVALNGLEKHVLMQMQYLLLFAIVSVTFFSTYRSGTRKCIVGTAPFSLFFLERIFLDFSARDNFWQYLHLIPVTWSVAI